MGASSVDSWIHCTKSLEGTMKKIKRNAIRCNSCGEEIESKSCHDYTKCKCGKVAVDGGKDYLRRAFVGDPDTDYTELSEYE